jgi:release factor glutamine methyltransferase
MTIDAWLRSAQAALNAASVQTSRLDSLVLAEDVLGLDRAQLLAKPDTVISESEQSKLTKVLNRRLLHEPLAYIRGRTEFYGRDFIITPAVLEPRPESETIIQLLVDLLTRGHRVLQYSTQAQNYLQKLTDWQTAIYVADVGCGSGALGITAKLELPQTVVELLDISTEALKVAKLNVDKFTLHVSLKTTDLLADSAQTYDVLLCNLPYVPDDYEINTAAMFEPEIAIFGGPDGLDLYRKLFRQIAKLQKRPLFILSEAFLSQHKDLQTIASQSGYLLERTDDFVQLFTLQSA